MPQLEFIDCKRCGKRVAKTARSCHHCERILVRAQHSIDDSDHESHHAASFGGYDPSHDDFDYDEFVADEFPDREHGILNRNRWKYVSILLIVVFVFLFLTQFFTSFKNLGGTLSAE